MTGSAAEHYERYWGSTFTVEALELGPTQDLGPDFRVMVFPPRESKGIWSYGTVGLARVPEIEREYGFELHLHAPEPSTSHVELLTVVAHYHVTGGGLGWGHTVNFGRPWLAGSRCTFGLLSTPYCEPRGFEWVADPEHSTHFLWLLPITGAERSYKIEDGLEALEKRFDLARIDFLDPARGSVV